MKIKTLFTGTLLMLSAFSATAEYRWVENTGTIEAVMSAWENTLVVAFKGDNGVTENCYVPKTEEIQIEAVLLAATTKQNVHYWCDKESGVGYAESLKLHRIDLK